MPTSISKYCRVKVEPCSRNSLAAVAAVCLSVEIINKNEHHEDNSNNVHFLQVCNSVSPAGEATRNINSTFDCPYESGHHQASYLEQTHPDERCTHLGKKVHLSRRLYAFHNGYISCPITQPNVGKCAHDEKRGMAPENICH